MVKIVLVDNRVKEHEVFLNSLNDETKGIIFDYENDTYDELIHKIKIKSEGNSIESLAFVSHGQYDETFNFLAKEKKPILKDIENLDAELNSWNEMFNFLLGLQEHFGLKFFDLLGCALLKYGNLL